MASNHIYATLLLLGLLCVREVHSTPGGAGDAACTDSSMSPASGHGGATQTGDSPYGLEVSRDTYSDGDTLTVTLKGERSFAGFLVMALPSNDATGSPIGSFEAADAADAVYVQNKCTGGATHTANFSSLNPHRSEIKLTWMAPSPAAGNLTFYATFVENSTTYWVKIASEELVEYVAISEVDNSDCGTGSGCFHNCEEDGCDDFILKWTNDSSSMVTFQLQGALDDGYVALGLSTDMKMTNVTIVACVATTPAEVKSLYAETPSPPVANGGDVVDAATTKISHTDGILTCQFKYDNEKAKTDIAGGNTKWKDLSGQFHAFIARGEYKDGALMKHGKTPIISKAKFSFLSARLENEKVEKEDPDDKDKDKDKDKNVGDGDNSARGQGEICYLLTFALSVVLQAAFRV